MFKFWAILNANFKKCDMYMGEGGGLNRQKINYYLYDL